MFMKNILADIRGDSWEVSSLHSPCVANHMNYITDNNFINNNLIKLVFYLVKYFLLFINHDRWRSKTNAIKRSKFLFLIIIHFLFTFKLLFRNYNPTFKFIITFIVSEC